LKRTLHLRAENSEDVARAAALLRGGGLVAFATETVYGLGANALSAEAVAGIFAAKGRPAWDPLIVHVFSFQQLSSVARVESELAKRVEVLAEAFWPGPLTMLLPRTEAVPDAVTAGRPLVGVRVPGHPVARKLLQLSGIPVAAPSANRFGHVSPTTAEHVLADLDGRIDAVLDAGPCAVGVESTVLDVGATPMVMYRAGGVLVSEIEVRTGVSVQVFRAFEHPIAPESLPSPGVGIRHYAPEAVVRLTNGNPQAVWAEGRLSVAEGARVGVLLPSDWPIEAEGGVVIQRWARWGEVAALAAGLFAGLRALEEARVDVIVCPLPEAGGLGDALRDRLLKAATPK
jgi:L-threonylcarbamoyladenylate synthase